VSRDPTSPLSKHIVPATVRAVLFDAVGTLMYPDPPVAEAYHRAGREFGSGLDVGEIERRFRAAFARSEATDYAQSLHPTDEDRERRRWEQIVGEVFDDVRPVGPLFESLWTHFAQARHWSLFGDVACAWRELLARGRMVGIASNFDSRLHAICDGLPMLAECQHRFVSSEIGYRKPAAEFFVAIQDRLGLDPAELLLVGDDLENDFCAAQRAGWHAVLVVRRPAGQEIGRGGEREVGEAAASRSCIASLDQLVCQ
jgi:putative hydrolase of the HAD superfamily